MKIDLLDGSIYTRSQPYDQLAWLRENDPVHWHEEPDGPGFWVLTRHADVKALETDSARKARPAREQSAGGRPRRRRPAAHRWWRRRS